MRSFLGCLAGVAAFGVIALSSAACESDKESLQAAANAPIGIETSQLFVTVENKSGGPLMDLRIAVQTPGAPYTYLVSRLEHGQKKEVPLNAFSSRDGTALSLRMVRPRSVHAEGTDMMSKKHEAQVPWK